MEDLEKTKKYLAEYFNWDAQIEKTKSITTELDSLDIKKAIEAFEYLRNALGEDFPEECYKSNNPIKHYFVNKAPWTRAWFTWLAEAIKELKAASNIEVLFKKLRSGRKEDFDEVITIFEMVHKFSQSNFKIEIEPIILNDNSAKKKPDLRVRNKFTEEDVLVEVSRLSRSATSQRIDDIVYAVTLTAAIRNIEIKYAGRFYKNLSDDDAKVIRTEIESNLNLCMSTQSFCKVSIEGLVDFGFTPANKTDLFDQWIASKELQPSVIFHTEPSVLDRIKSKIQHKSSQLSSSIPSILVIRSSEFSMKPIDVDKVIGNLGDYLYRYPQIMALAIIGSEFGDREANVLSGRFSFFIVNTERHAFSTSTLLILNRFNKSKVSMHTLNGIYSSFAAIS